MASLDGLPWPVTRGHLVGTSVTGPGGWPICELFLYILGFKDVSDVLFVYEYI